jgi:hypothetical protein
LLAFEALLWLGMAVSLRFKCLPLARRAVLRWPGPSLRRPDPGRGLGVQPVMDEHPRGRPPPRKTPGRGLGQAPVGEAPGRLRGRAFNRIGRAVQNRNGHGMKYSCPIFPITYLDQIVGPHQPDETDPRKAPGQRLERVRGIERAQNRFEGRDPDSRMAGGGARVGQTRGQRRGLAARLEGVLGRDQPPDLVEAQAP